MPGFFRVTRKIERFPILLKFRVHRRFSFRSKSGVTRDKHAIVIQFVSVDTADTLLPLPRIYKYPDWNHMWTRAR